MEVKSNLKFMLPSNDKNQIRRFDHDLNKKLVTATNTLEGFAWDVNLRIIKKFICPQKSF